MNKPVCIVSGAAGNLGKAVTSALQYSFHVEATVRKETPHEQGIHYNVLDLTNESDANDFVQACVNKHGKIQAAALIAGGFEMGSLKETSYAAIEHMIAINFKTVYTLIRPIYQHMQVVGGGNIILISSKTAHQLNTGSFALAYSLSKAMLLDLAEMLNANRTESKVTIHVIIPGTIDTPLNRSAMPQADTSKWIKPETLADKILSLCNAPFNKEAETIHPFY